MRLFLDIGVGRPNTEAWDRDADLIVGVEPSIKRYRNLKSVYPGKLLNIAVSDKKGWRKAWVAERGDFCFFKDMTLRQIKVRTTTIDEIYRRYGQNADEIHLWADIEGAELLMLKGAKKLLASGKIKWINLEIRKNPKIKNWCSAEQVYNFLDKYGFKPNIPIKDLPKIGLKDVEFK